MPDTQPVMVDRTNPHYKVGAATTAVESLLHGAYGPLSPEQTEKLLQLRDILRAERTNACPTYGQDGTRCVLPPGHPVRPDATGHDLRVTA